MRTLTKILPMFLLFVIGCKEADNIDPALKATYPSKLTVTAVNTEEFARTDAVIGLPTDSLTSKAANFNSQAFLVLDNGDEIPSQAIDINSDGEFDEVMVKADFQPNEMKTFTILYAEEGVKPRDYPKMTQAELSKKVDGEWQDRKYVGGEFVNIDYISVPPEHTDHSFFFRYEGPGWESDKVGYRYYLDWRNAIDIFGKKTSDMVLQNVGLDGFDSYHEMADWGMDILKVGGSLGIGSLGMMGESGRVHRVEVTDSITCRIAENGAIYSQIRTKYFGWEVEDDKYDVISDLSIEAGSRMTKHDVQIDGSPENLCTGIVKHPDANVIEGTAENGWTYFATFGKQSLAEDTLGMAVLYKVSDLVEVTEDSESHVVVLNPENGELTYYFLAAWEKEPDGIQTEEAFKQYLEQTIAELNSPIKVEL